MTATSPPVASRLWGRLMELAQIGATASGGVNRQALSAQDLAACRLLIGWAGEAGLRASTDAAGNLFLTLKSSASGALPIMLGSHLDTQPNGGKFDGALGVVGALEVVSVLAQRRSELMCDLVVVAWMNEEGSRFAPGMMGSEVFAGQSSLADIRAVRDADGVSVGDALDRWHHDLAEFGTVDTGFALAAYLELHIEQGPLLEARNAAIGVVTGIQGKKTFEIRIDGTAAHAGTMPMAGRRDALQTFTVLATAMQAEIGAYDAEVKFTIGRLAISPNAPSVVPARVVFSVDLRHPDNAVLDLLGARLAQICERLADPCRVTVRPLVDAPSNLFDLRLQALIADVARSCRHEALPMLSAAGHDARHLAKHCPSAMLFVPSRDGISHSDAEWTEPSQVEAGYEVLLGVVERLVLRSSLSPKEVA